jgi:competence protein ComFC
MFLIDVLFPKFCLGCSCIGSYICNRCFKKLRVINKPTCLYCHRQSYLGLTHPKCSKKLSIDGTLSIYHYDNFLKKIIKNIKYRLATVIWDEFWKSIPESDVNRLFSYKNIFDIAFIQPVPLSQSKYRLRGFNQSIMMAKYFKKILNLPIINILERSHEALAQAQIKSKKLRLKNVKNVFLVKKQTDIKNKTIVLIDDVITTGSTIKEACRILKIAGANKVYALTLAKG